MPSRSLQRSPAVHLDTGKMQFSSGLLGLLQIFLEVGVNPGPWFFGPGRSRNIEVHFLEDRLDRLYFVQVGATQLHGLGFSRLKLYWRAVDRFSLGQHLAASVKFNDGGFPIRYACVRGNVLKGEVEERHVSPVVYARSHR